MKRSILLLTVVAVFIAACQNKTPEQKIDSLATAPDTTAIKNKDTASLSFTKAGNAVTGQLDYNYFEKDKNSGTIAGVIKGDTILADYTFNAEGTSSVREVIFIKKGDQLAEGYGPMEEKGGKTVFTDKSQLKFGDYVILSPIECK
jgi:hypothetical protein